MVTNPYLVYPVEVAIVRKIQYHRYHFPNNWTGAKFLRRLCCHSITV